MSRDYIMDDLQDGNNSTEGRAVVSAAVAATHTKTLLSSLEYFTTSETRMILAGVPSV